jgi:hypothetical protein
VTPYCSHLNDQLAAASQDATHRLHRLSERISDLIRYRTSRWVTAQVVDLSVRLLTGRVRGCPHVDLAAPTVVLAVAWRPGRLWCGPCLRAEGERMRGTTEDHICDVCRTVVEVVHPVTVAAGPLLFRCGACPSCFERETAVPGAIS